MNFALPIVTSRAFATCSSQITLRTCNNLIILILPLQEIENSLDVNAEWLGNIEKAVDHLSTKCPESDVLDLRRDADAVHVLQADISSCLQQLVARTSAQMSEVRRNHLYVQTSVDVYQ